MLIEVSVKDFHRDVDSLLERVESGEVEVTVMEGGKAVAALISPSLFAGIRPGQVRSDE